MSNSATSLQDRTVIVTGAGAGIGLAIATHCLQAGARVAMLDLVIAGLTRNPCSFAVSHIYVA